MCFLLFENGEGAFAGGEGDAAEVAVWVLAVGFCPLEGVFRISEVVGEHCAVRRSALLSVSVTGFPIRLYIFAESTNY